MNTKQLFVWVCKITTAFHPEVLQNNWQLYIQGYQNNKQFYIQGYQNNRQFYIQGYKKMAGLHPWIPKNWQLFIQGYQKNWKLVVQGYQNNWQLFVQGYQNNWQLLVHGYKNNQQLFVQDVYCLHSKTLFLQNLLTGDVCSRRCLADGATCPAEGTGCQRCTEGPKPSPHQGMWEWGRSLSHWVFSRDKGLLWDYL